MSIKRTLTFVAISIALASLAVIFAYHTTQRVHAQDQIPPPVPERISFGSVGITSGQTIRVSVANTQQQDSELPVDPCKVAITFRYGNGLPVRNRAGEIIRKVVTLDAGKTAILDVNFDADLPRDTPDRVQIRAVVTVILPAVQDGSLPVDPCIPAVEVINNANGRTQFSLFTNPGVIRGFNPQPDPPAGE